MFHNHAFPTRRAKIAAALLCGLALSLPATAQTRWQIADDGAIVWNIKRGEAHQDDVEMSGQMASVIVTYGVDTNAAFTIRRHVVFPMLRFAPNATRDHFALEFGEEISPRLFVNRAAARFGPTTRVRQRGILRAEGVMGRNREIVWTRSVFPSPDKPAVMENTTLRNVSSNDVSVVVEDCAYQVSTSPTRGIYGAYVASTQVLGVGEKTLKPGESMSCAVVISARRKDEAPSRIDADAEEKAREARVNDFLSRLQLETPDRVLNTAFAFAKIRGSESIYRTKGGLMHGPGGGAYYAAIWANDQAEYANPFFGFLGDEIAVESATNAYRHFARFMNPDYRPIPSSIIAEGEGTWHGAGDRGDMAMIAYGASRFALARGDKTTAEQLWPLIEWCLEYCKRKVSADGVVGSDSDELENRFPSGKANLCTSSLYYDALISSAALARELGRPTAIAEDFTTRAQSLRAAIESYFGRSVEGFDTYRYFDKATPTLAARAVEKFAHYADEPDHLRAWICIPLTMGINDRAEGTINALFSPRLWTADGLATEADKPDFWDRSTLYALRGVFAAGATEKGMEHLTSYSTRRLLGDHVPYPVEAYPEGNQRHLSAESDLYCRIYTEGLFGMRPTGFRSFNCTPRLPKDWPGMALKKVRAFGNDFDLVVSRAGDRLQIQVLSSGKPIQTKQIEDGQTAAIDLGRG